MRACYYNKIAATQQLLRHGADPNHVARKLEESPLPLACLRGKECVYALLDSGADVKMLEDQELCWVIE